MQCDADAPYLGSCAVAVIHIRAIDHNLQCMQLLSTNEVLSSMNSFRRMRHA